MKVLVMGGTRFNGLALVRELVIQGHEVTICNRGRTQAELPEGVQRLIADRSDHDRLCEVLGSGDFDVVHDMTAYHPEDVDIMIKVLHDRVGHYIFASSTVTYQSKDTIITEDDPDERGPTQIEYGLHKLLCEDRLFEAHAELGFPATSVPFSMVVGPHNAMTDREQRMFKRLIDGRRVLIPGDGSTLLQLGDVGDQSRALVAMMGQLQTFGRRYNLTGAHPLTRNEYVATISGIVGREAEVRFVPDNLMEDLWTGRRPVDIGPPSGTLDVRPSSPDKPEDPRAMLRTRFLLCLNLIQQLAPNIHWWDQDTVFGINRLRSDIGWVPTETTESMLDRAYRWWHDSGGVDFAYDWDAEDRILAMIPAAS